MPRHARFILEGVPHHITQRGNYKQGVFETKDDFRKYCYWTAEYALKYNIEILSYCLMSNHVHFVLIPHSKQELSQFMSVLHMRYSQYMNEKNQRTGHLWQARYFSCIIQTERYLLDAMRYVERNPVRANLVQNAWDYVWSSARRHIGCDAESIIKSNGPERAKELAGLQVDWREYLSNVNEEVEDSLRDKTSKRLCIGSEEFVDNLENKYNFKLKNDKAGRPPKT